MAGFDVKVR